MAGRLSSKADAVREAALDVDDFGPGGELGLDESELLVALDDREVTGDEGEDEEGVEAVEETARGEEAALGV
jgi:hypothetical protein